MTAKRKGRKGRPRKDPEKVMGVYSIRATAEEVSTWWEAAERAGHGYMGGKSSLSAWMRDALNAVARERLKHPAAVDE